MVSSISHGQIELFEATYNSDSKGVVKIIWNGKISGNKNWEYDEIGKESKIRAEYQNSNDVQKIRMYLYFPVHQKITLSSIALGVKGQDYDLVGKEILKYASFNYQLIVHDISDSTITISRNNTEGNLFLEFNSGRLDFIGNTQPRNKVMIELLAESNNNLLSRVYSNGIDHVNYDQISSILFVPQSDSTISTTESFELSEKQSIVFHFSAKVRVSLKLYGIRNLESNQYYADSSLLERIRVSPNLSLELKSDYVLVQNNNFNNQFSLIEINLNPNWEPKFKYNITTYSANMVESLIEVKTSNKTEYGSQHVFSNENLTINNFQISFMSPMKKLSLVFSSANSKKVGANIDSVSVTDLKRNLTESFYMNDFRQHISTSGKKSTYTLSKLPIFSGDRLRRKLTILILLMTFSLVLFVVNPILLSLIKNR
jgi:hypothetical protein